MGELVLLLVLFLTLATIILVSISIKKTLDIREEIKDEPEYEEGLELKVFKEKYKIMTHILRLFIYITVGIWATLIIGMFF